MEATEMQPPPPPPPQLPVDMIVSILSLLPPNDPRSIFRASRVCRQWHDILTDPDFCRSYRDSHRTPPLLGYVVQDHGSPESEMFIRFDARTDFRPRRPGRRAYDLILLDARHGRVIFACGRSNGFVIWDPVTGGQSRVPAPPSRHRIIDYDVAVMCGADGCDHRLHCHGAPSLVALVGVVRGNEGTAIACLYSTESASWSDTTSIEHGGDHDEIIMQSKVLVSNALYFVCHWSSTILRYNLVSPRELSVINWPEEEARDIILMTPEDGVLVCAQVQQYWLRPWSSRISPNGALEWEPGIDIQMDTELPQPTDTTPTYSVIGIMDSGNIIFLRIFEATFTIDLTSGEVNEVYESDSVIPYISFYTLDHANSGVLP